MTATGSVVPFVIGAIALVAVAAMIVIAVRTARSQGLEKRFGPEYRRLVRARGSKTAAERELAAREARVRRFQIEQLPPGVRARYTEEWRTVQTRFVDEPRDAVVKADHLVTAVLRDRGYPISSFEQAAADISPDHPRVVEDYRIAHGVYVRTEKGEVPTEDLRQAMQHYRSLFDDLVAADERKTA